MLHEELEIADPEAHASTDVDRTKIAPVNQLVERAPPNVQHRRSTVDRHKKLARGGPVDGPFRSRRDRRWLEGRSLPDGARIIPHLAPRARSGLLPRKFNH